MTSQVQFSSNTNQYSSQKSEEYNFWWNRISEKPKEIINAPKYLIDYNMCLLAVRKYGFAIKHIPEHLLDVRLVVYALKRDGLALDLVPVYLRSHPICTVACESDSRALRFVPHHLVEDIAPKILRRDGQALKFIKKIASDNLVAIAIESDPLALQHVAPYKQNYALALKAVKANGEALQFVNYGLFDDNLIQTALKNDRFGWVGQCIPKEWYAKYKQEIKSLEMDIPKSILRTFHDS